VFTFACRRIRSGLKTTSGKAQTTGYPTASIKTPFVGLPSTNDQMLKASIMSVGPRKGTSWKKAQRVAQKRRWEKPRRAKKGRARTKVARAVKRWAKYMA